MQPPPLHDVEYMCGRAERADPTCVRIRFAGTILHHSWVTDSISTRIVIHRLLVVLPPSSTLQAAKTSSARRSSNVIIGFSGIVLSPSCHLETMSSTGSIT